MVLGPLDKRKLRTRCQACSSRRIKCKKSPGGSSCLFCTQKKLKCVPPAVVTNTTSVFVNHASSTIVPAKPACQARWQYGPLYPNVTLEKQDFFISYFFTSFLANNNFSGGALDLSTITSQFQSSPSLYNACIAVGALGFGKKLPIGESAASNVGALKAYRTSIYSFQKEIDTNGFLHYEACLWTTFFLGIFELMYDATGHGWMKHIRFGTSRLLEVRGPDAFLKGSARRFFLNIRIFEIVRSVFSEDQTFLEQPAWKEMTRKLWEEDMESWHPKEALLDLMIDCTSLGHRISRFLISDVSPIQVNELEAFGAEGLTLRNALNEWHVCFLDYLTAHTSPDPASTIAILYYNALSIYLSGLFDYCPLFLIHCIPSPFLPQSTISSHVNQIMSCAEAALRETNLAGTIFLFPLRVLGARAETAEQRGKVSCMLEQIAARGWVVAEEFVRDLEEVWDIRDKGPLIMASLRAQERVEKWRERGEVD